MNRLSDSGVKAYRNCPRSYYWSRVRGIRLIRETPAELHAGKLWHLALAAWFMTRDTDQVAAALEAKADAEQYSRTMAMFLGYKARWGDSFPLFSLHEQEIEVPIINPDTGRRSRSFIQFGYLDMLARHHDGKVWLWEHKTTSQITGQYLERLWGDSQITGYVAALQFMGIDVAGVVYDVAQKPRLRQRKGEAVEDFWDRLTAWHLEHPEAYAREEVVISDRQIEDWRRDLWQTTQGILRCHRSGVWPRNTSRCYDWYRECQYASLCRTGNEMLVDIEYEPRETPAQPPAPSIAPF